MHDVYQEKHTDDCVVGGHVDRAACRKVELAVGALGSLSLSPSVAVQYLSKMLQGRFSPTTLESIIECEPALAAAILALAQEANVGPANQRHAIRLVLERMDGDQVRDVVLAMRVSVGWEIETAEERVARPTRNELVLHSLATACCARRMAEAIGEGLDPQMAYSAGLLHDIGKLALQDIMPKSLAAIVKEAEQTKASLYTVEQARLGTNHSLLGRQLARRWHLPEPVALAIWLHHSDVATLANESVDMGVVRLVWAADHIARMAGIGSSGSYDDPEPLGSVAGVVGLHISTLQEIRGALPKIVREKASALGLETPNTVTKYCDLIHTTATSLSRRSTKLTSDNRTLAAASSYLDFAREFLLTVEPSLETIDMAEDLARRWQRFFQTGSICLYLVNDEADEVVDVVLVEALGHSNKMAFQVPDDVSLVPRSLLGRFAVIDMQHHIDWLIEQVAADFDRSRTKVLPLCCRRRVVAILAFELNYPADATLFAEKFETAAAMAGTILGLAAAKEHQARWIDHFVQAAERTDLRAKPGPVPDQLEAVAEMAAGIAHELNNPLSVISGRAQLLAGAEADAQRKLELEQIQGNAREASAIVDDLMSFAEPSTPRPETVRIQQIIEESVELACQKTKTDQINAQVQVTNGGTQVFVDSAQVVCALANVITNAVESYTDPMGPVKITVAPSPEGVSLQVSDLGCGMDADTLRKATQPFFSAKPAGRKRGMGLAYAIRLIRLNGGSLEIESHLSQGTTVSITLPRE
jgi:putative nucleotidyltransferase with HDIG domain